MDEFFLSGESMKEIEIIIIGAGLYVSGKGTDGYGTILPAVFEWQRESDNVSKVHCVATSSTSAEEVLRKKRELQKKTGVRLSLNTYPESGPRNSEAYKDTLLNTQHPACAIIAVPDHLHYKVAKDCIEAGLHTLIVKPFTPTFQEGNELVHAAEKKGIYGAVEFHKRWDRSNLLLRDKVQSGELGLPLNCWIEYSQRKSLPLHFFSEWSSKTTILQYLGVHYIDLIRFVTNAKPLRVMAIGQKTELSKQKVDTYDAIQCLIEWEMPDGTHFTETLLTSWVDPESSTAISDQKIKFIGSEGRYEADQKERGIRVNTDTFGVQHINPDFCMPYGVKDGEIYWQGYGIESIKTFLNDVVDLQSERTTLKNLNDTRPSFKESLISTMILEAAHVSLNNESQWKSLTSNNIDF